MRLPSGEQRALNAIEHVLEASEPRMTAMFAMFTKLAPKDELISTERLARRNPLRRRADFLYLVIPVLATVALVATLVVGLATSRAVACRTVLSGPRSLVVTCAGRPLRTAAP
jgi:Protein of unknown function (DUF3040)